MAIQAQLYSENFGASMIMENHNHNNNGFDPQQQHHHHQQLFQLNHEFLHKNPNFLVGNFLPNFVNQNQHQMQSVDFYQSVCTELEKQRLEFEHFVNLQNERLRLAIQEQRKQQTSLLMKKYELKIQFLLKQKDDEIARATNRTAELENFLKRMEMENQTWQRAAKENEAMAASLNVKIERLRESACLSSNGADDAESCCVDNRQREEEDRVKMTQCNDQQQWTAMICRCCNAGNSCVVILPCRHLCACIHCEAFLDACPVCGMVKKGSIEALI